MRNCAPVGKHEIGGRTVVFRWYFRCFVAKSKLRSTSHNFCIFFRFDVASETVDPFDRHKHQNDEVTNPIPTMAKKLGFRPMDELEFSNLQKMRSLIV